MSDDYDKRRDLAIILMRQNIDSIRRNEYFTDSTSRHNYGVSRGEVLAALEWTMEQLQTPADIRREFELVNRKLDDLLRLATPPLHSAGPAPSR